MGGGGTPICRLDRYAPLDKVWFMVFESLVP